MAFDIASSYNIVEDACGNKYFEQGGTYYLPYSPYTQTTKAVCGPTISTDTRLVSSSAANLSSATQTGLLVSPFGDWSITHVPAVGVVATITKAAGGAGVRHICTSIMAKVVVAVTGSVVNNIYLRDGAAGAGTILWASGMIDTVQANSLAITLSNLNIIGTANTAMTLEFSSASAATNYQIVSLTGHSVS